MTDANGRNVFAGMFFIAFATLVLQISLMRLMSVVTWYHLAFFAISVAMLGMTAGAVRVYLSPRLFDPDRQGASVASACLWFAISLPFMLGVVSIFPIEITVGSTMLYSSLIATGVCVVPFYFSGIAVTASLTRSGGNVSRIYASDLVGAALGCMFVLLALNMLDVPSLIIFCGVIASIAGWFFAGRDKVQQTIAGGRIITYSPRTLALVAGALMAALTGWNANTTHGLQPVFVKGQYEDPDNILVRQWNSFSRIMVRPIQEVPPLYWGASELAPQDKVMQAYMNIDGEAGTSVRQFRNLSDIDHLRYDVTAFAYTLGRQGNACIIGVGGGRDLQTALLHGHSHVYGIELNPIFVNLLQTQFRDFAGLANRPDVTLVADEARSYLSRTPLQCSILQMALIDTWAATGAGAFSLSENSLYTLEGWRVFSSRLTNDGVFTVSRWYNKDNLGETGRLVSLAMATLLDRGIDDPSKHLALVTSTGEKRVSTLLFSLTPFSEADIARIKDSASALRFDLAFAPTVQPTHPLLKEIIGAKSISDLERVGADSRFNFSPPRDDSPYFFNLLKVGALFGGDEQVFGNATGAKSMLSTEGVLRGNLVATHVLLTLIGCVAIFAVAAVIVPLHLGKRVVQETAPVLWRGALFFSMIGAGFMFVEIGLIQRLSVFLGHPVYGIGVLLFSIIGATGLGSFLSDRLPLKDDPWNKLFPVVMIGLILLSSVATELAMSTMTESSIPLKALVSVLIVTPIGVLLGFFYPTGMRVVESLGRAQTPWYWALNGIMGTLISGVAVFVSIYFSITLNFVLGSLCYALAGAALVSMANSANRSAVTLKVQPAV